MECIFCGKEIPIESERIFVDKKGNAQYFCSKKCEINLLKLGRKPRKVKWTQAYRKEKAIRLRSKQGDKEPKEKTKEKEVKKEKLKKETKKPNKSKKENSKKKKPKKIKQKK